MPRSIVFQLRDQNSAVLCKWPIIPFSRTADPFFEFSNYYENAPFIEDGVVFRTVMHYFHFKKWMTLGKNDWAYGVLSKKSPTEALKYSESLLIEQTELIIWLGEMNHVMEQALRLKFAAHRELQLLLKATANAVLIEDNETKVDENYWGWGASGTGENNLGTLLMMLREEICLIGEVGDDMPTRLLQQNSESDHTVLGYWMDAKIKYHEVRQAREKVLSKIKNVPITKTPLKSYGSPLTKNEYPQIKLLETYCEIYDQEHAGKIPLIAARQAKLLLFISQKLNEEVADEGDSISLSETLAVYHRVPKVSPVYRELMKIYLGTVADVKLCEFGSKFTRTAFQRVFVNYINNFDYLIEGATVFKFEEAAELPQKVYYDPEIWGNCDNVKQYFNVRNYSSDIDTNHYLHDATYVVVAGTEWVFSDTQTYFKDSAQPIIPLVVARVTGINMRLKPNIDAFTLTQNGMLILDELKLKAAYSKIIHLLFSAFQDHNVLRPIISPFTEYGMLGCAHTSLELPAVHSRVIAEVFSELLTRNDYAFEHVFFAAKSEEIRSTYFYDLRHALKAIQKPAVDVINNSPLNIFFALHENNSKNLGLSVVGDYFPEPGLALYEHWSEGLDQLLSSIATSFVKSPSLFPALFKHDDTYVEIGDCPKFAKDYTLKVQPDFCKGRAFIFADPSSHPADLYTRPSTTNLTFTAKALVTVNPKEPFINMPLQKQLALNMSHFNWNNVNAAERITKKMGKVSLKNLISVEHDTKVDVLLADCLQVAYSLSSQLKKGKVAVLSSSSFNTVGGLVFDGEILSDEAHLCRSTDLLCSLLKYTYENGGSQIASTASKDQFLMSYDKQSLASTDVLYSRGVTITSLLNEDHKYYLLPPEKQRTIDVISSAALHLKSAVRYTYSKPFSGVTTSTAKNCLVDHRNNVYIPTQEITLKLQSNIIRSQLNAALLNGVEILVLGAHGCGAEKNDPIFVAKLYKEIISQEYQGQFAQIIFAISDLQIYRKFATIFGKPITRAMTTFFVSSKSDDLMAMAAPEKNDEDTLPSATMQLIDAHDLISRVEPSRIAAAFFPVGLRSLELYQENPLTYLRAALGYFVSADPQYPHPLVLDFKLTIKGLLIRNLNDNDDLSSFYLWLSRLEICDTRGEAYENDDIIVPLVHLSRLFKTLGQSDLLAYQSVEKLLISESINPYLFLEPLPSTSEMVANSIHFVGQAIAKVVY